MQQQGGNKSFSGGMSTSYRGSRSNQGSNGNVSHHHHGGHGGNSSRRNDHRHSPDNNNSTNTSSNSGGGRNAERYSHGGGRELNGRHSHGGGGHGTGYRGAMLARESPAARTSRVQSPSPFDSRNHKEIVDFFQHNFDIIMDQAQNGSAGQHKSSGGSKGVRKGAVYYQPPARASATTTTTATAGNTAPSY